MSKKKITDNEKGKSLALKRAYAHYEISKDNGTPSIEQALFQHSILCQTFFPYRNPGETDYWEREQGRATLSVQALKHKHPVTGEIVTLGIPYGAKVRLIMAHINTQIIQTQSPVIEVADSMTAFIKNDLGLDANGRNIREIKNQLSRLAGCTMSVFFRGDESDHVHVKRVNLVEGYDLWFPKTAEQRTLWSSYIEVSEKYANDLLEHAIPLDMRAVAALSNNALAMDIYTFLAYRLDRINPRKPVFIPWGGTNGLHAQFGFGYKRIRKFRERFIEALKQVKLVYPDARIEIASHEKDGMPAGLMLYKSPPPIGKKLYLSPQLKSLKKAIQKREGEKKKPRK